MSQHVSYAHAQKNAKTGRNQVWGHSWMDIWTEWYWVRGGMNIWLKLHNLMNIRGPWTSLLAQWPNVPRTAVWGCLAVRPGWQVIAQLDIWTITCETEWYGGGSGGCVCVCVSVLGLICSYHACLESLAFGQRQLKVIKILVFAALADKKNTEAA